MPALSVTTIEMGTVLEGQTVVQQYGTGSGGSRLLTGTTTLHVQLEENLRAGNSDGKFAEGASASGECLLVLCLLAGVSYQRGIG